MGKALYLNNFECQFIDAVKDVASTGTPATELNYGILRLDNTASGVLTNPTGGDYYLLTAFKRAGGAESAYEVMKVTAVDIATYPGECRITVSRAQEGTTAKAYVTNDYVQLRWTKGSAQALAWTSDFAAPPAIGSTTPAAGSFTTLSASGLLDISSASAGQVKFPSSQNASSNANTLDDYEEGSATLTLTTDVTPPTTPITNVCRYTKVGRLVTFEIEFTNVNTTGATGNMRVTGLPFTPAISTIGGCLLANLGTTPAFFQVISGSTYGTIYGAVTGVGVPVVAGTGKYVYINVTYTV